LSRWISDVPVMVVADLLGFDEAELVQVARWMADFVACLSPLSDAAQLAAASVAAQALMARLAELVAAASARPDSALALIQAEAVHAGWTEKRALLANLVGMLSQTFEATAGLLGNSIIALTRQTGIAGLIQGHLRLLELVNEVSRHDPSIQNTRRFVARPLELMGAKLQAGDCILLVLAAAGRDPDCFVQPEVLMLYRPKNDSSGVPGFGHGRHQCPGQQIACTIAAAALGVLFETGLCAVLPQKWIYRPSANARIPVFLD
ncbi:MAG: cytochrome P450, partial [Pseudomonadota bacterium]